MSAWKRNRGWTERHGWGPDALARWIGRQRREARRGVVLLDHAGVDRLLAQLAEADEAYDAAVKFYELAPLKGELFEVARAAYVAADERRDALRAVYKAAIGR